MQGGACLPAPLAISGGKTARRSDTRGPDLTATGSGGEPASLRGPPLHRSAIGGGTRTTGFGIFCCGGCKGTGRRRGRRGCWCLGVVSGWAKRRARRVLVYSGASSGPWSVAVEGARVEDSRSRVAPESPPTSSSGSTPAVGPVGLRWRHTTPRHLPVFLPYLRLLPLRRTSQLAPCAPRSNTPENTRGLAAASTPLATTKPLPIREWLPPPVGDENGSPVVLFVYE